jgi:hypothetical protein
MMAAAIVVTKIANWLVENACDATPNRSQGVKIRAMIPDLTDQVPAPSPGGY